MAEKRECKLGCGREVIFAKTPEGKAFPLDAEPVVSAFWIDAEGVAKPIKLYQTHFATCEKYRRDPEGSKARLKAGKDPDRA